MKLHSVFLPLLVLIFAGVNSAQVRPPVPRTSQKMTIAQTVGTTEISITYSRPAVKGRPIWGDAPDTMAARAKGEATLDDQNQRKAGEPIVPYGHLWRAGANEATLFVVADDVLINGSPLAAGRYSFHAIPMKSGDWTLVFNTDDGQWGSFFYDQKKDALRVTAKAEIVPQNQELLTYSFDPVNETSATVNLRWERLRVPFTVQVKDVVGTTMSRLRTYVANAKPDDWAPPYNAAIFARDNKLTGDATRWFEQSLTAVNEALKSKETFQLLTRKFNSLMALGRKDEALAVGDAAVARGKADKVDTAAFEKRLADVRAK